MGDDLTSKAYNKALQDSLKTIKRAHKQLHVVTKPPAALTSCMELYGILLGEVTGIRSKLVTYLECTRAAGQNSYAMQCVNRDPLQEVSSL
jgi:hypothetical protein